MVTRPRASLEIAPHHEGPVSRRLACALISGLGIVIAVMARLALAHPHLRHETGTLSIDIRDENNAPVPARLTFRPASASKK